MGFLAFLSSNSKKSDAAASKTVDRSHDKRSKKDKKDKQRKKMVGSLSDTSHSTTGIQHKEVETMQTTNEVAIEGYMDCLNKHGSEEELLGFFKSPNARVLFDDAPPMKALGLVAEIKNCYAGFSDIKWSYESIKEIKPGVVLVEGLSVAGTHTHTFKFGPFPPIPATGKYVILDSERLWITMKDGKMVKQEIVALGNLTGPPGLYINAGGSLEMPTAAEE